MTNETAKTDAEQIRDAVTERYLETWMYSSVRDIAERLGWSESKVRKVLKESFGAVNGTRTYHAQVQKYSKDYPGMEAGVTQAWVYEPSLSHLGELLVEARKALAAKAGQP